MVTAERFRLLDRAGAFVEGAAQTTVDLELRFAHLPDGRAVLCVLGLPQDMYTRGGTVEIRTAVKDGDTFLGWLDLAITTRTDPTT